MRPHRRPPFARPARCRPLALGAVCGLAAASVPGAVRASGLDAPAVGSLLSGPLTTDPAAVYHNPAQLGFLKRPTLLLGAGLVVGSVSVERERRGAYQSEETLDFATPLPAEDQAPEKTGKAKSADATPFSPAGDLFFSTGFGDSGVTAGVGVFAPYAALAKFPDDGAQRFAVQEAFIAVTHFSGAIGLKANKYLGLGAGVSYVLGMAEISKVQDFGALSDFGDGLTRPPVSQPNEFGPDAPTEVRELDVLGRPVKLQNAVAHTVTFNLGLAVNPTDALRLALTYQHGADVDFEGDFVLDMDDDFFTGDLEHVGLKFKPTVTGDAHVRIRLPKRIGAAAGYDVSDRLHLELRGQYVTWSDLKAMYVELHSPDLAQPALGLPPTSKVALLRNYDDTVSLAVAGRFQLQPRVHLLGLLGYDSPASPDSTIDASSPDGHRLTFGAGAGFSLTRDTSLIGDARFITLLPRTVTGSDDDLGNGDYSLFLAAVSAHLQVKF